MSKIIRTFILTMTVIICWAGGRHLLECRLQPAL